MDTIVVVQHYRRMLNPKEKAKELVDVIHKVASDRILLRDFLIDILSPAEYQEIATRWQIVKQLTRGIPQREIAKNLKVSVATVGRGARELLDEKGGFKRVLKRLSMSK